MKQQFDQIGQFHIFMFDKFVKCGKLKGFEYFAKFEHHKKFEILKSLINLMVKKGIVR